MGRTDRRSRSVKEAVAAIDLVIRVLDALDEEREAFVPIDRHSDFHAAMQTIIKTLTYWRQQL